MFLNTLMLLGIGAAVVPWVLHLLSRSRFKSVDWGAMMFLEPDDSVPRQSSRLSQFLLLVLRAATVSLLAVALARPALKSTGPAPAKGQPVMAVILLDCSAAMKVEENGHPNMVLARGAAKQVLGLHKGDRVALLLMGQKQPADERRPTADLWDVARRIESAEPGNGSIDVARELMSAAELFEGRVEQGTPAAQEPGIFADFYVITDRQASAWRGANAAFGDLFRQQLRAAGVTCRLFAIPVGSDEVNDIGIESIELLNPPAVVNQPAELLITARNYGSVQWAGVPLTVSAAGPDRTADRCDPGRQSVNMTPRSTATFHTTATFRSPGTHVLWALLKAGNWPADDRFNFAVEVGEPMRVLVLTSDPLSEPGTGGGGTSGGGTSGGGTSGASCLQLALAPFTAAHLQGADPASVDVAPAEAWSGPNVLFPVHGEAAGQPPADRTGREVKLSAYQVVVLANVEQLTPRQAVALEQFVYDGGGALIAPGPLSRPEDYNARLFRDGAGILPAALAAPTAPDDSEQTALSGADLTHPVFRFMAGRPDLFLSATVDRYFPSASRSPVAHELAHYVSGDPFLIESSAGKGKALLMTTSLGPDWTNLPLSSFYLPFVQSAVRYLAESSTVHLKLNLHPGDPIEVPLDESAATRAITVNIPGGEQRPAEIVRGGDQPVARFSDTDAPGVYQVRVTDPAKPSLLGTFVVRPSASDADPSPMTKERWDSLKREVGFETLDPAERPLEASHAAATGRRELWRWALAGVLCIALLEMALGRAIAKAAGQ